MFLVTNAEKSARLTAILIFTGEESIPFQCIKNDAVRQSVFNSLQQIHLVAQHPGVDGNPGFDRQLGVADHSFTSLKLLGEGGG